MKTTANRIVDKRNNALVYVAVSHSVIGTELISHHNSISSVLIKEWSAIKPNRAHTGEEL